MKNFESKWLRFEIVPQPNERKTFVWDVVPTASESGESIGQISWFGAWRKYCFNPKPNTVFDVACLMAISEFIEARMAERIETPKDSRERWQAKNVAALRGLMFAYSEPAETKERWKTDLPGIAAQYTNTPKLKRADILPVLRMRVADVFDVAPIVNMVSEEPPADAVKKPGRKKKGE